MVSVKELGKSLSKLMITINLFEKFSSSKFIMSNKVFYMTRQSYKLRNKRDDVEHRHPIRENLQY